MRHIEKFSIGLTLAVLLFVGCSRAEALPQQYGEAAPLVEEAVTNLADRLNVDPESISVESVEQTEFPDASLGVPEPGEMYAQVVTPGYIIVLEAGGETYEFHAGGDRVVLVPEDRPEDAAEPKPTATPES